MVSQEDFKTVGYLWAILGILGSILRLVSCSVVFEEKTVNDQLYCYQHISTSIVGLVFFIMLLAGIYYKKLLLVKVFRIFLITSFVVTQLFGAGYIGFTIFYEQKTERSVNFILALLVGLAIFTGLFLLLLWIVNGVIKYIEHGKVINDIETKPNEADNQQKMMKYEAVLTRF
uniref:Uncharacterized protein n=1 Tax=Culex tarsalis TaxID=7177 RepID=A0A1Q3FPL4_CULTA